MSRSEKSIVKFAPSRSWIDDDKGNEHEHGQIAWCVKVITGNGRRDWLLLAPVFSTEEEAQAMCDGATEYVGRPVWALKGTGFTKFQNSFTNAINFKKKEVAS